MGTAPSQLAISSPETTAREEVLVVIDGRGAPPSAAQAAAVEARLPERFPGRAARVLVATSGPEVALVDPASLGAETAQGKGAVAIPGGDAGAPGAWHALLVEGDRRGARAAALLLGSARDESVDWLRLLFEPVLEGSYDFVGPAYERHKLDGMLNTAIVYPLLRALFGRIVRQPAGGEAVLSLGLARELLADSDWRRDPVHAGTDAWMAAKVLAGKRRVCQAWLGALSRPDEPFAQQDASHILARVVGPVFHEMERATSSWQRVEGSTSVPAFGRARTLDGSSGQASVEAEASAFRLGLRELGTVWSLVLPPSALLGLKHAAAAKDASFSLDDGLWARVVYDFALAYAMRAVERQLLLRSMTPLYLGFVAGFVNETRGLDGAGTDARVEALCGAFEREKRYAITRWRWPDHF